MVKDLRVAQSKGKTDFLWKNIKKVTTRRPRFKRQKETIFYRNNMGVKTFYVRNSYRKSQPSIKKRYETSIIRTQKTEDNEDNFLEDVRLRTRKV